MEYAIKNAVIKSVRFDTERGLSAWLMLDYGGTGQGFGGFLLYAPEGWTAHNNGGDYTGHFIYRCMQIADVEDWPKLVGKTIRVRSDHDGLSGSILAIGHIINDEWFDPRAEFAAISKVHKDLREELADRTNDIIAMQARIEELEAAAADKATPQVPA